jgi:hypothetical protein
MIHPKNYLNYCCLHYSFHPNCFLKNNFSKDLNWAKGSCLVYNFSMGRVNLVYCLAYCSGCNFLLAKLNLAYCSAYSFSLAKLNLAYCLAYNFLLVKLNLAYCLACSFLLGQLSCPKSNFLLGKQCFRSFLTTNLN